MKIKKYVAHDMPSVLEAIRRDFGPEAVIISNRRIRQKGLRGWLGASTWEVMAALEEKPLLQKEQQVSWRDELTEIKDLLARLAGSLPAAQTRSSGERWRQLLVGLEISDALTERLLEGLPDLPEGESGENLAKELFLTRLAEIFPRANPGSNRVKVFVGPTGVGKTTTIAKLAAEMALFQNKKAALLTLDTFRVGSAEQLNSYGEILGIPVQVVLNGHNLQEALGRYQDRDVVFIDTAGRPGRDKMHVAELNSYFAPARPLDIYLVLSCSAKLTDLRQTFETYQNLDLTGLIFTKIDETGSLGAIADIVEASGLTVAYITNGQNVPEDIMPADSYQLAKLILKVVN